MIRLRLGLVLVFLAAPLAVAVAGGWRAGQREPARVVAPPDVLGDLAAVKDDTLGDSVLEVIEPEDYLLRLYESGERSAWVYVAFYGGYGNTAAHDPNVCYPSQGFVLSDLRDLELALPAGARAQVKLFRADLGGRQELVLWWFQPATRWPRKEPLEPFLRVGDALLGAKQYAFVRLSTPLERGPDADDRAREVLAAMAAELAPWVRETLAR